jgi:hypothetical protein
MQKGKIELTQKDAENTPAGGVVVGKRNGQTMIYDDASLGGYFVGKLHSEGGIKMINKSTGQLLEVQGSEIIITAPAVNDPTKHNFNGETMTNREILSKINSDGGGVSFANGGDIPAKINTTDKEYEYGGKMVHDTDIAHQLGMNSTLKKGKQQFSSGGSTYDVDAIYNAVKKGKLRLTTKEVETFPMKYPVYDKKYSETVKTDFRKPNGITVRTESGEEVLIDGNHRMNNAYLKGRKTMKTYYIEDPKQIAKFTKKNKFELGGENKVGGHLSKGKSLKQIAEMHNVSLAHINDELSKGLEVEKEHFADFKERTRVAKDHLVENPNYYTLLSKAGLEKGGKLKKEDLVKDAENGNTPARDLNNYNDVMDLEADGMVGGDSGIFAKGGGVGDLNWDTTFTDGFNKGQKLSEQEIETIDVYNDSVYGLLFKSGGFFDAKTEETIGLLSITKNSVSLAVILEKDPSGFNSEAIKSNQKIKRRLHNLAEKSNRKIVLNNNASGRVNRQFPYLLVSENDAENYDLATEFYEKLETPRKESRKKLIEELEKEKEKNNNDGTFISIAENNKKIEEADLSDLLGMVESGNYATGGVIYNTLNPKVDKVTITATYESRVDGKTSVVGKYASTVSELQQIIADYVGSSTKQHDYDYVGFSVNDKGLFYIDLNKGKKNTVKNVNPETINATNIKRVIDAKSRLVRDYDWTDFFEGAVTKTTSKAKVVDTINVIYLDTNNENKITSVGNAIQLYNLLKQLSNDGKLSVELQPKGSFVEKGIGVGITNSLWQKILFTMSEQDAVKKIMENLESYLFPKLDFTKFKSRYNPNASNNSGNVLDLSETKVWLGEDYKLNKDLIEKIQEKAFSLGWGWANNGKNTLKDIEAEAFYFADDKSISYSTKLSGLSFFVNNDKKNITVEDVLGIQTPTTSNSGLIEPKIVEAVDIKAFTTSSNLKETAINVKQLLNIFKNFYKIVDGKDYIFFITPFENQFSGFQEKGVEVGNGVGRMNPETISEEEFGKVLKGKYPSLDWSYFLKEKVSSSNSPVNAVSNSKNPQPFEALSVKIDWFNLTGLNVYQTIYLGDENTGREFISKLNEIEQRKDGSEASVDVVVVYEDEKGKKRIERKENFLIADNGFLPSSKTDAEIKRTFELWFNGVNFDRFFEDVVPVNAVTQTQTATASAQPFDFTDTKINVMSNPDLSKKVQERAFELGWEWENKGGKVIKYDDFNYLYFTKTSITYGNSSSSFYKSPKREITEQDVFGSQAPNTISVANPKPLLTDFTDTKIWIGDNPELSRRVQEKAFELGYAWGGLDRYVQNTELKNLYFNGENKSISSGGDDREDFDSATYFIEITEQDIFGSQAPNAIPIANPKTLLTDLTDTKIWIGDNPELSKKVQERAFELGWEWAGGKIPQYLNGDDLYFYSGKLMGCCGGREHFESHLSTEIFADDLFDKASISTAQIHTLTNNSGSVQEIENLKEVVSVLEGIASQASQKYNTAIYDDSLEILKEAKEDYELTLSFTPESSFMYERIELMKKTTEIQKEITRITELKNGGAFYILSKVIERLDRGENWKELGIGEIMTNEVPEQEIESVIYTEKFKNWFGNWEEALNTKQYDYVSKAITKSGKPCVMYHGAKRIKYSYRQVSNGVVYLAENRSYAEWFSASENPFQKEGDYLTQCFVNLKNPIDLTPFGVEEVDLRDIIQFIDTLYPLAKIYDVLDPLLSMEIMNNNLIGLNVRAWNIIRQYPDLNAHIRDNTTYDGFIYYENNPSDKIFNEETGQLEDKITKATAVFNSSQVKLVDAMLFDGSLDDWRFEKGGKVN